MGILRSEQMQHGTLILPVERAREYVDLLGNQANIQLEDMNEMVYLRPYRTYIQRIVAMERSLRFVRDEIRSMPGWQDEIRDGDLDGFFKHEKEYNLNAIEAELRRLEGEFTTIKENLRGLVTQRNNTTEALYVARLASAMHTPQQAAPSAPSTGGGLFRRLSFENNVQGRRSSRGSRTSIGSGSGGFLRRLSLEMNSGGVENTDKFEAQALMNTPDFHEYGIAVGPAEAGRQLGGVDALAGAVARDAQARFSRALFRATRGNVFTHFVEIHEPLIEPKTNKQIDKSVFVVYFQSKIAIPTSKSFMREKITRVCKAFDAAIYTWYTDHQSAEVGKEALQKQIKEQGVLVEQVRKYMRQEAYRLVKQVAGSENSVIEEWRLFCAKEKSIYATLNCFEGNRSLRASCWYPSSEEVSIRTVLTSLSDASREVASAQAMLVADKVQPRQRPPTYIRRNDLTDAIQDLVDTYGMPRYQEANPALLSIVTFPFLFGIMYGDVGHGLMLFLVGLVMCIHSERLRKLSRDIYAARYLVTMMGFFATYAGLLYNDFFSIGLELFETRWDRVLPEDADPSSSLVYKPKFDTKNEGGVGPYPFGLDPSWHGATNELMFVNSLKMKLSVIIGVVHMFAGIVLRWANAFHERNLLDFVFECIPMTIFMVCFFGFMDAMIIFKWVTPIDDQPSIVNSMICMALPMNKDKAPMFGPDLPKYMMLATVGSVLLMLLPKPLILLAMHGNQKKRDVVSPKTYEELGVASIETLQAAAERGSASHASASAALLARHEEDEEEEEFEFSEVMMHQIIETIEYTLGTVSHTASYLRLWALSLAHNQLAHVFFEKTIGMALEMSFPFNGFALYIAFAVWLAITLAILLGMDVMECTLHTLRLHWVEFQSKFYKADGYRFQPYSHRSVLEAVIKD